MSHGREYLLQANDESDMNAWVSLVNWAAASKALGIPTTPMTPSEEQDGKARYTGINNVESEPEPYTPSEHMATIGLRIPDTALAGPLSRPVCA
jgi:hypothetical protein